jgi:hypothetical protein
MHLEVVSGDFVLESGSVAVAVGNCCFEFINTLVVGMPALYDMMRTKSKFAVD